MERLRIGLLLNKHQVEAWEYLMLSKIIEMDACDLVLAVIDSEIKNQKKQSKFYKYFNKIDRKLIHNKPDAQSLKDINELVEIRTHNTTLQQSDEETYLDKVSVDIIKEEQIDILLNLGLGDLNGEITNASTYGVWFFHFGDDKKNRGKPHGFWEVMGFWGELGVALKMRQNNEDSIISRSTTLTDKISVSRSKNANYWKSASFVSREILQILNHGEANFYQKIGRVNQHPIFHDDQKLNQPLDLQVFKRWMRQYYYRGKNILEGFIYMKQWMLLFKLNDEAKMSREFHDFIKINPPKDRFWADPHVLFRNDKYYIFIEELIYKENKGFISLIEMDQAGNYTPPVKIIEQDYHMSYPFVFEDKGTLYMIPETSAHKDIQLYKCTNFPNQWKLDTILLDNIEAVDTTILFQDGKYWMFCNVIENKGASSFDELFIFYSDELESNNWKKHPQNPIISDVKLARPAGNFFKHCGQLYRPSQDCSNHYGYGMAINRVEVLNEEVYREVKVDDILPDWDEHILATHTLNSVENLTVIDAINKRSKW